VPFDEAFSVAIAVGSCVWSVWDMGNESEVGAMKAFAWAAVVGRLRDSILKGWEMGCEGEKWFNVTCRVKVYEREKDDLGDRGDGV